MGLLDNRTIWTDALSPHLKSIRVFHHEPNCLVLSDPVLIFLKGFVKPEVGAGTDFKHDDAEGTQADNRHLRRLEICFK